MRQSSTIIHKGGKEERYEIYIEDYVMSYLKGETGKLELSEFCFYGFRENGNKRYVIYGAGRDKKLPVFDKYTLLEEIGCRLTQAGPAFYIRERDGIYEIKGYKVFYQENKEMKTYLIERQKDTDSGAEDRVSDEKSLGTYAIKTNNRRSVSDKTPHSIISVQLGVILVALIAIVINSTNSYDKMKQLNQSAVEVFFAMENQEAEGRVEADEPDSSVAVSDSGREDDVLKLVTLENDEQPEDRQDDVAPQAEGSTEETETEGTDAEETAAESVPDETAQQDESQDDNAEEEGVEALSRNVARYYEIERGDTLYTISQKIYGDTIHVQRICELNQITDPDHIRYGQKIILP